MNILLLFLAIIYVLGAGGFFLHVMADDMFPYAGIAKFLWAVILAIIWPFLIVSVLFSSMFSE